MTFPKQIQNLIESFERLPGVGPKTAERLAFYLLHVPDSENIRFADSVHNLKQGLIMCSICKNISDQEVCEICADHKRDTKTIAVVENPLDVFSLEKTGQFHGLYHVLHGLIDPLNNIGPDELFIKDLLLRLDKNVKEVIIALNPTMEGEATAMYLAKQIKAANEKLKITRLGVGLPIGGDLQYADDTTLTRALEGRRAFE